MKINIIINIYFTIIIQNIPQYKEAQIFVKKINWNNYNEGADEPTIFTSIKLSLKLWIIIKLHNK